MNKNITAVFAAICGLFMASCDTPSDLRPEDKVSVDYVEPGTRNTFNIGKVNEVYPPSDEAEAMPDRDLGGNTLQPGDSILEATETNTVLGTTKENIIEEED
ncbi:hypothetical protein [Pontibacter pamirensis]|uniref:hypothetical protein n=1 Tax=Pontibacter pamirensis TaxID=2562824 RepID=UPI001389EA7F|nr:hypothetical protein [Pontibacter pamirensis]